MPKPLRADARRNRERLLEVAEQVFAESGSAASTEEVARRAGVGIGTLFRHFPTKDDLLKAVFVGRLDRLARRAATLAAATDPGVALFTFFTEVVEQSPTKNALIDALTERGIAVPETGELRAALGGLLARAQAAGAVRAEVRTDDVIALLVGATRAVEQVAGDEAARRRVLAVVLDGLRAP